MRIVYKNVVTNIKYYRFNFLLFVPFSFPYSPLLNLRDADPAVDGFEDYFMAAAVDRALE
jgi:hypothetical protein